MIRNTATAGGNTVTLRTGGQTGGIALASGFSQAVWTDGADLRPMSAAVSA